MKIPSNDHQLSTRPGKCFTTGFNLPTVKDLCELSPDALDLNRSEQVEHLSSIKDATLEDAKKFFARNHVTGGMEEFLQGAVRRLSGQSPQAVFELRQAMGGGKTHNMIALGLLARFPELRDLLPVSISEAVGDEPAIIASIHGRDIDRTKFLWGDIAEQLERADDFRDHWVNGPVEMSEGDWMRLIGDRPTLILLDELPPYLAMAHTKPVGEGTLLDLMKYSLANLFSAAMKLKRCVVVIASLEAAYDDARRILGAQLADLRKETSRGAMTITPVDLNTDEIYDILRKRLFSAMPDLDGEEVDRVATAYRNVYEEAVRGKSLVKSAEQMADEIVSSYPFHPSYKDILSLFKENEKFRQTRGLIQFTSNLLRSAWRNEGEVFLIGAQYLNFSDTETRNQVKEIERSLESALAGDVFDSDGSSHAQGIDAERGDQAASQVATLLFVSSLSDNTDGIRGLSRETLAHYLATPGRDPIHFTEAFDALRERCWYLHRREGDRWFFSDIANVRKQIEDKAGKVTKDRIDDEMRRRLEEIFRPVDKRAYSDLVVLPRIDEVNLTPSKRTCLVLSPDAKAPPADAERFFHDQIYKNAFCVVTGDGSQMGSAESGIRRLLAVEAVKATVADTPRHRKEIEDEEEQAEISLNSTIKSLFNSVWYPQSRELKCARIDLGHYQERGIIHGERAVESVLSGGGAKKLSEINPETVDRLVERCEDQLFPEGQSRIRWFDLIERAASNPRWIWLPPKGMDQIKAAALANGRWAEENGFVDKEPPEPQPTIRVATTGGNSGSGESEIELIVTHAGRNPEVRVASGLETLATGDVVQGSTYRTTEVALWFQVCNVETGKVSEPCPWKGSIAITHDRQDNAGTWFVTLAAAPDAELRWNVTGINPKDGEVYKGTPIEIDGRNRTVLYVHAAKDGVTVDKRFTFDAVGAERTIDDERPARVVQDFQFASKGEVLRALRAGKQNNGVRFYGVSLTVGEGERSLKVRGGDGARLTGAQVETMVEGLRGALGDEGAEIQLRFRGMDFPDGFALRDFASQVGIDIPVEAIEQDAF